MSDFTRMDQGRLRELAAQLEQRHAGLKDRGLDLDMTRGKPSPEQLDLSLELLALPGTSDYRAADGTDCRNYGGLDGLPEMKALFAGLLGLEPAGIIVGGSGSLPLMHDAVVRAMLFGVPGGDGPWSRLPAVRFLCPSPGYDRHFAICEHLGIEMIPVEMRDDGPDMDEVERRVAEDASVKGMWCVPKYSNPTGAVYSDAVVDRLAAMPAAAGDFRIFWDNAYAEHHLGDGPAPLRNVLQACRESGHPDRVLLFASTSKMSFAGAGVAAMGASGANVADARKHLAVQTIGPDKINQLRHVRLLVDLDGLRAHMARHAEILRPKFEAVWEVFERELGECNIATWTYPRGGYFISLDTLDGCAGEVVGLAAEAGVKLTAAGATFPYGRDPRDRNIRIAPSLPPVGDIRAAMEVVSVCVQLASARKLQRRNA